LALFAHRTGAIQVELGPAPPLAVIVIDPGGEVDTLAYNRQDHREALGRMAAAHREAFYLLQSGLRQKDWRAVGAAATLSATLHQAILYNPLLESALGLAQATPALGVCRAHSGTLLGLLLDPATDATSVEHFVARRLPEGVSARLQHLVDGGPRLGLRGDHP
jgi:L-threonine kinase